MIRINSGNVKLHAATAILIYIQQLLAKEAYARYVYEIDALPYDNDREQGFMLQCPATGSSIVFAEYRNSDDIVLYYNNDNVDKPNLTMTCRRRMVVDGWPYTESVYNAKVFLPSDQHGRASVMVLDWLLFSKVPKR